MPAASSDPRTGQLSLTGQIPVTPTGQIPVVTGQIPVVSTVPVIDENDPARRPDVLLRRRMPPGHQISAWWMIGAFLAVSGATIALMNFFPA
ncbi:hypothetical protein [Microbacterium dauci]|uniref:UDP-N-acetylmuramyl pentapeptide phosphotransferase n=1 Tax=Microbacterium dauci TaxID=3048008 RepID=A0ABT6ZBA2_9MICO|nr:hypothetical protein [Microbacterium sp. LX3-4]MDJ1113436.1 hypothetical protein [Microbacterium sp. LX3-4]